jgi:crotonobetainyl-CoA:carnitine CoA-transferase CaiB-like acyl-CoA transferase
LGADELSRDERFATNNLRVEHRETLMPQLAPYFLKWTTAEWEPILTAAGVPCAPVNTLKQAFSHEHMAASGMIQAMKHPELGEIHVTGVPFHFSRTGGDLRRLPPQLGEHTMEILRDILHMEQTRIDGLTAAGAI